MQTSNAAALLAWCQCLRTGLVASLSRTKPTPAKMKFRPCIDLHCGKVKQIVGGTLTDHSETVVTNHESDKGAAEFAA